MLEGQRNLFIKQAEVVDLVVEDRPQKSINAGGFLCLAVFAQECRMTYACGTG